MASYWREASLSCGWRMLTVAGVCLLCSGVGWTAGPEYQARRWDSEEGLPQNWVQSLCLSGDGGLLLRTRAGLVRFDGLEFRTVTALAGHEWPQDRPCTALANDAAGSIWIGTKHGLFRWRPSTLERFDHSDGLGADGILCLVRSASGGLWIGTDAGLSRWHEGRFTNCRPPTVLEGFIRAVCEDPAGRVWVGTPAGVRRFDPATSGSGRRGTACGVWGPGRSAPWNSLLIQGVRPSGPFALPGRAECGWPRSTV